MFKTKKKNAIQQSDDAVLPLANILDDLKNANICIEVEMEQNISMIFKLDSLICEAKKENVKLIDQKKVNQEVITNITKIFNRGVI